MCACVFFLSLFLYIIIGLGNRQQFHYDVILEEIAHHWVTPPQRIKWEVSSNKVNSALTEGSIAEPLISVPHPAPAPLLPPPPPPLPSAPHFLAPHLSFILSSLPSVKPQGSYCIFVPLRRGGTVKKKVDWLQCIGMKHTNQWSVPLAPPICISPLLRSLRESSLMNNTEGTCLWDY